jgi:Glycosyl hydrolases family 15/Trefoil (P-type) domain
MRGVWAVLVLCAAMVSAQSTGPVLGCFPNNARTDCGNPTITQQQCLQKGCCWLPVNPNPNNEPWCVNQTVGVPPPPFKPPADGLPFNTTERTLMMSYFLENLDVCCLDSSGPGGTEQCQNCGGVVAAPDYNTGPGGNYVYAWMRDSALSMRALMETNNDSKQITQLMKNYVSWVLANQVADDPNDIDIRTEPKFNLPTPGHPFTGGWCRPQVGAVLCMSASLVCVWWVCGCRFVPCVWVYVGFVSCVCVSFFVSCVCVGVCVCVCGCGYGCVQWWLIAHPVFVVRVPLAF